MRNWTGSMSVFSVPAAKHQLPKLLVEWRQVPGPHSPHAGLSLDDRPRDDHGGAPGQAAGPLLCTAATIMKLYTDLPQGAKSWKATAEIKKMMATHKEKQASANCHAQPDWMQFHLQAPSEVDFPQIQHVHSRHVNSLRKKKKTLDWCYETTIIRLEGEFSRWYINPMYSEPRSSQWIQIDYSYTFQLQLFIFIRQKKAW